MAGGELIVCETDGHWAAALRREADVAGLTLRETRSVSQCWELLRRTPAGFVAVELTGSNAKSLFYRLGWLERDYPLARLVVLADRRMTACQWLLRQAGALHFVWSTRQADSVVELAVRHWRQAPGPVESVSERIWAGLPWAG